MTVIVTSDGYSGWPTPVTSDGWPNSGAPVTSDGWVTPFNSGGGGIVIGGPGGGGGFHKKRRKRAEPKRLNSILDNLKNVYDELTGSGKGPEVGAIVRVHARSEAEVPQLASVNWLALENDARVTSELMALYQRHQIEQDDEDFLRLL